MSREETRLEQIIRAAGGKRRSKYGAVRVLIDGHWFDSKAEGRRYRELRLLEHAGQIAELELQPRWTFEVNGVRIGQYTADFRYENLETGKSVVEDVKGVRTRDLSLRLNLMRALFGIEVQEIRKR